LPEVHRGATDPLGDLVITLPPSFGNPLCPVLVVDISHAHTPESSERPPQGTFTVA
jgi:hypothetical protein